MQSILQDIVTAKKQGKKLLAILLDPEKITAHQITTIATKINQSPATHILVGGSSNATLPIDILLSELKKYIKLPLLLFPGNANQISNFADAILYLSLISGRNADYLIEHQVAAVPILKKSNLEVISTSYILVGSDTSTSVSKISKTIPIKNKEYIVQTAQAGEYLGHKLIYLEAGSGAKNTVPKEIITLVAQNTTIPILVGGGIQSIAQIKIAYQAGADLVVIGTAFENNTNFFST